MKGLGLFSLMLLFSTASAFGQKASVVINQAKNAVAFTEDGQLWGLRINGKQALPTNFKSITYQNGLYILCDKKGDWAVADEDVKVLLENTWRKCDGVKVSDSFVIFQKVDDDKDIIYDRATWEEVKAKEITYDDMAKEIRAKNEEKGTSFDPTSAQQKRAVKQAAVASEAVPFGAFSFRTNSAGKQELIVDDQVMFTADSFDLFLTETFSWDNNENIPNNIAFYKKSGRWVFRVEEADWYKSKFGLYALDIDDIEGQKVVKGKLTIPIKYMGVWDDRGRVKCELGGFKSEYRNYNGVLID